MLGLADCVSPIVLARDVVSGEGVDPPVATDRHCNHLGNASADQIPDRRPAEIVEQHSWDFRFLRGRRPGFTKLNDQPPTTNEDEIRNPRHTIRKDVPLD